MYSLFGDTCALIGEGKSVEGLEFLGCLGEGLYDFWVLLDTVLGNCVGFDRGGEHSDLCFRV